MAGIDIMTNEFTRMAAICCGMLAVLGAVEIGMVVGIALLALTVGLCGWLIVSDRCWRNANLIFSILLVVLILIGYILLNKSYDHRSWFAVTYSIITLSYGFRMIHLKEQRKL